MQQVVKYYSLLSYILKTPSLLTQGFRENKKAHKKIFKNMCNFDARVEWKSGRRAVSYHPDFETRKNQ